MDNNLLPRRRNHRLQGYDYSQAGAYFITVVTRSRECFFADAGLKVAVEQSWLWLAERYDYVRLDEYVIMPNHLHGIVFIDETSAGRSRTTPTGIATRPKRLGSLVGAFKTVCTQEINRLRHMPGEPVWQRDYHDHIVRDDEDLNRIREYILDNPRRWNEDPENPSRIT